MAGHGLTTAHGGTAAVDRYLAELAIRLRGPRHARARVLTEIHDGLAEAIDSHLADGTPPETAATAAIAEFGDPDTIARSFAPELATATARRTIAAFILTGPIVGIWWLLLLHPAPWRTGPLAAVIAIPALPLVALAVATAAGTFATTGRLMRWLPESTPGRALSATIAIASLCLAADLTVLTIVAAHLATGSIQTGALAAIAATASILRVGAAVTAIRVSRARRDALRDT
jgi:hypothetical protein